MVTIKTNRLILRQWQESDLAPFAALNADPRVREFFPGLLSREESDHAVKLMSDYISQYGWGLWAASLIETGAFIGFIGLNDVNFQAHFTPAVEIGWRLAFDYWGKGFATEGAKAALAYGFETLNLPQIVSFTTLHNMRSRHVMEKIGLQYDPHDDFDHPKLPEGNPLKRHVLYRMSQEKWRHNALQPGTIYEHYKGKRYKILGVARHSETLEELVVYQALYGEQGLWVRPLTMFLENVLLDKELKPRFKRVEHK